jgi:hypothetical protein
MEITGGALPEDIWFIYLAENPGTFFGVRALLGRNIESSDASIDGSIGGGSHENESIAQEEVRERANGYCDQVGDQIIHVKLTDEAAHYQQIATEGDGSIGQVEARESGERLRGARRSTVAPSEALVPEIVVNDGSFDG